MPRESSTLGAVAHPGTHQEPGQAKDAETQQDLRGWQALQMHRQAGELFVPMPSERAQVSALYHWPELSGYECLGCGELIEIPSSIRHNPEDFMIWREFIEKGHEACGLLMTARVGLARKPVAK